MSPMTNISKCLAVLATVASLAYLGVVSVSVVGGPNYDANFDDPNLSDVKLTKKVDEETGKANYHVEARRPQRKDLNIPAGKGQQEASPFKADFENDSKVLPQIVIAAREFVKKMQIRKEKILTASILLRTDQIKETRRLIAIDERAMKQRMKQIDAEIEAVQKRLIEKLNAANKLSTDAIALREKAVRRRNELKRLRGQVDELLADRFRLDIQQKKLGVLQIRLKGIILRLAGRGQRLQDQGATLNP